MERTFIGMVETGEPLIRQVLEAIRQSHEAEGVGPPVHEVERLRLTQQAMTRCLLGYGCSLKRYVEIMPPRSA